MYSSPREQKIQPMGLVGRREAIRAPTVGYASDSTPVSTAKLVSTATPRPSLSLVGMGISPVRKSSMRASAISTTHTAHSDQASQAAVRWLIPPTPLPCFLVPFVTTTLCYKAVARVFRQPLRGLLSWPDCRFVKRAPFCALRRVGPPNTRSDASLLMCPPSEGP